MKLLFRLKQYMKALFQNRYLPYVYRKACSNPVRKGRILFADAHSSGLTANMKPVYQKLLDSGYDIELYCMDMQAMSVCETLAFMRQFMKAYAQAEYVFITSYFLPVSSCRKREGTTVVQLWHSGGLMKKMGYDTEEDIPKYYKGNPTANYDLVTVSAPCCELVWEKALHLPNGSASALGLPRTDIYFNEDWNAENIRRFYDQHPEARDKKICLYAPSFEGNAAHPYNRNIESGILETMKKLEDEWFFIIKVHPHMKRDYPDNISDFATEELFAVTDLLITDYSSVVYDYLLYRKPFLLYAPDLEDYKHDRGLYLEYESLPSPVIRSAEALENALRQETWQPYISGLDKCCDEYMGACDGHATERIIEKLGLWQS